MTKIIRCPCGTVVRARDDESLVAQAQQHAREVHQMELTREQALAMAGAGAPRQPGRARNGQGAEVW
jgi:Protein of unknown function (DUF1059)